MTGSPIALAHVTLPTRDVAASAAFYQKTLGFEPIDRPDNITGGAAWLQIAAGQQLHLLEVDAFEPTPYEREFGRHVALNFPLDQFDALKERLSSSGAELIAPQRETPFERFFFRDPNGFVWEIIDAAAAPEV